MPKFTAKGADKFVLYQEAVQSPEAEAGFIDRVFKNHYKRQPSTLREDFCGTALISCYWAKKRPENQSWGIDLHQPTLDWGIQHNLSKLKPEVKKRVHLLNENVLSVKKPKMDVVGAFNFSYFIFKERRQLVEYFTAVHNSLNDEGLFVLDAYGGYEAQQICEEETKYDGFTYVWDQAEYNPTNDDAVCHIHFKFPDGTMMRKAFSYDWRLWTLGGIRDALIDAGFTQTDVYWEGTDKKGEGNGSYRKQTKAENTPGWNAYITALP